MTIFKECGENGREWTINEKYSYQDFTNADFTQVDPDEFSNMVIVNSCFYQEPRGNEIPPYPVFPAGSMNMRLINDNLNNVAITSEMDISNDGWNRCSNEIITIEDLEPEEGAE